MKKYIIITISIFVVLYGIFYYCVWANCFSQVEYTKLAIIPTNTHIVIGDDYYLWDTGAMGTLLFADSTVSKTLIGATIFIDYTRNWAIIPLFFAKNLVLHPFRCKNASYSLAMQTSYTCSNISGIIGMPIIGKANWLVDFQENSMEIMPQGMQPTQSEAKMELAYKRKMRPKTTIFVQGKQFDDILIDSGSYTDLILFSSDIAELNKIMQPDTVIQATEHGLYDSIAIQIYTYKNITVNGFHFDNLNISENPHIRLIGCGFFRRFDKLFLDTKNQKLTLY